MRRHFFSDSYSMISGLGKLLSAFQRRGKILHAASSTYYYSSARGPQGKNKFEKKFHGRVGAGCLGVLSRVLNAWPAAMRWFSKKRKKKKKKKISTTGNATWPVGQLLSVLIILNTNSYHPDSGGGIHLIHFFLQVFEVVPSWTGGRHAQLPAPHPGSCPDGHPGGASLLIPQRQGHCAQGPCHSQLRVSVKIE